KIVFADEMNSGGKQVFDNPFVGSNSAFLWRMDPFLSRLNSGFVWEEDARIVGNVTLLPTANPQRYLVANVAIQSGYRRRGIARALMEEAQKAVKNRGGTEVRLQVERENEPAKALYISLGYTSLGTLTTWNLMNSRYVSPHEVYNPTYNKVGIVKLPSSRWEDAYRLDMMTKYADLYWPDPLQRGEYRNNLKRRISDFFSGKNFEAWAVFDNANHLHGVATINSEWGRAHLLRIRVYPSDTRGMDVLEQALIHKLLYRLQLLPRRQVRLLHDADDIAMNELLPTLRFRVDRSLTQMRLDLK
ncbi:MAG: GNAT family N-acetyltransferase, partial [Candidatus Promineifilaceae bacterium]